MAWDERGCDWCRALMVVGEAGWTACETKTLISSPSISISRDVKSTFDSHGPFPSSPPPDPLCLLACFCCLQTPTRGDWDTDFLQRVVRYRFKLSSGEAKLVESSALFEGSAGFPVVNPKVMTWPLPIPGGEQVETLRRSDHKLGRWDHLQPRI